MACSEFSLSKKYEDGTIYQQPFVDEDCIRTFVRHKGYWFPVPLFPDLQRFEQMRHFALKDNDILVASFPRSGTTWLQHTVWLIVDGINAEDNGLNIEQRYRFIDFEMAGFCEVGQLRSPQLLKSHTPYNCLPAAVEAGLGKVIYIARNAKDACVSNYHWCRMWSKVKFHGTFNDYFEQFTSGQVAYGPWQDHVAAFWDHRHDKNVLFLFYEDLWQQPELMVSKIAEFLGRSLTVEQISEIVQRTRFDAMKQDSSANYSWWTEAGLILSGPSQFIRKGVIGDWQNYFTADMESEIHQRCIEPLERRGLTFIDRPQ